MDLQFYFDTAVLGPTYDDDHRHLVLSVSAAWEADRSPESPPLEARLQALLRPWHWGVVGFKLYRLKEGHLDALPDDDFETVDIEEDWVPLEATVAPARDRLNELFERCEKKASTAHHAFQFALSQQQSEEDPDLPNRQCWPDLLAAAGRWPGLLPYRLKLQFMFRVKAAAIVPEALYFLVPETIAMEVADGGLERVAPPTWPDDRQMAELAIDYRWANGDGPAIGKARIGGSAAPDPDQAEVTGALLDLATLWGRPDPVDDGSSHDWFRAVPEMVAEACDHPDALFDALTRLATPDPEWPGVSDALQRCFEHRDQCDALIEHALDAWRLCYGVLDRAGADGAHPLTSILSRLLGDAYDAQAWRDVLPALAKEQMDALGTIIRDHNARPEEQSLRILPIASGDDADGLDRRSGLDFVREAARTFAWLTSDAGLFASCTRPWLAVVNRHAGAHPESNAPRMLRDWLKSEDRDSFPLGAMTRGAWCTNGENTLRPDPAMPVATPLRAVVDKLHAAPAADPKGTLVGLLSNVDDEPVLPNVPLRDYLAASGIRDDVALSAAFDRAMRVRVEALRRHHLDGSGRALPDVDAGYPSAFGDPWPLDRVHDLMFPIDRPGHVESDDQDFEDFRRRIAGIGLLVRQAGKSWHCLASASISPGGAAHADYPALLGQPAAFAGELRTTMVAYRGEPWFERDADEALVEGYAGDADAGRALTDVQAMAHPIVRLPDLKFGQRYYSAPFLIGPGNALPRALCADQGVARIHPAHARPELFSAAGIGGGALAVGTGPYHYLRRVPVGAPLLEPVDGGTLFSRREDVHPLAHEVLAATGSSDEPLTLLCPSPDWLGTSQQIFRLQPPEVDMMVWLRHWRARISAGDGGGPGEAWKDRLQETLGAWMAQADAIAARPENATALPKFHDPAHAAYQIEVEQVWPPTGTTPDSEIFTVEGADAAPAAFEAPHGRTRALEIRIIAGGAAARPTIARQGDVIAVSGLREGRLYRVSASALVRSACFAGYEDADGKEEPQGPKIFAPRQIFGLSTTNEDGNIEYVRFARRTVLAEVAIGDLPSPSLLKEALKSTFDGRMLTVAADFQDAGVHDWRYVRTFVLERQRWAWSGRHVEQAHLVGLASGHGASGDAGFGPDVPEVFEDWGFLGRSDDDHVREFAASAANDPRTVVWREDLQSRRAAEYHRFRLRARSRYAGLMKDRTKAETSMTQWAPFALKFRPGATVLPRPKIAMLLPLTGGYGGDGGLRKLACLVQLEEAAFDEAGLPERIVVEAEMAGPDPILIEASPKAALTLDCRVHGPIGHSFDPDMPGARYRRASWVASFETPSGDAATGHPWPLVKLRVRREVPASWVWPMVQNDLASEPVSAGWIQLPRPSDQILVRDAAGKLMPVAASGLRVARVEGTSLVTVVRVDTGDAVQLAREPGFDAMFAVLTYQGIDARGIPGAEQVLAEAAVPDPDGQGIVAQDLQRAPPGTLRLRLLTVQRNPRDFLGEAADCATIFDLFARVGDEATSDARFRLMRVSLPIEET